MNRPPYFSSYEIQAGMAYANEAGRRGQLAQIARQFEQGKTASEEPSEAISTAPDGSREPAKTPVSAETEKKAKNGKKGTAVRPADKVKAPVGASATQL
jgi:hypothetical protein